MTLLTFSVATVLDVIYPEGRHLTDGGRSLTAEDLEVSEDETVQLTPVQVGQLFNYAWGDGKQNPLTEDEYSDNALIALIGQCCEQIRVEKPLCPFCGERGHLNVFPLEKDPSRYCSFIICTGCSARGPTKTGTSMHEAVQGSQAAWGKRTFRI